MITRAKLFYRLLLAVWAVVLVWQVFEHQRVAELARSAVIRRARDITGTLGLVIHSQRRWAGIVSKAHLESALKELVKSDGLKSIALLNASGEVVVSGGEPVVFGGLGMPTSGERWDKKTVTVINLVDLGANLPQDSNSPPTIVLPDPEPGRRQFSDRPPRGGPPGPRPSGTNSLESAGRGDFRGGDRASTNAPNRDSSRPEGSMLVADGASSNVVNRANSRSFTNDPPDMRRPPPPDGPPRLRRPPWMSEEDYKALIAKQGVHGLAIVLSTDAFRAACTQDFWLRVMIGGFAAISVVGFGLAWRTVVKSSEFQMRLVRASEMNSHLREMNVAAAGLAHETRNPLNIIRGLAQMISKSAEAADPIRKQSLEITDEVDRVTVQLNEFINYSKPREVRRSPVAIDTVINDVARALKSDLEDKSIKLEVVSDNLTIRADQQLLRQIVFNLLMNAIQAVDVSGQISIMTRKTDAREATLEVRDNGPGVPQEQREDIFRPYFTTRDKGTGLGLAVVKQIVMVHGWEVECLANNGKGAIFRVSRLEICSPS